MQAELVEIADVETMTDSEKLSEILIRLRTYETTVRGIIEAGKNNPSVQMILRANGIAF